VSLASHAAQKPVRVRVRAEVAPRARQPGPAQKQDARHGHLGAHLVRGLGRDLVRAPDVGPVLQQTQAAAPHVPAKPLARVPVPVQVRVQLPARAPMPWELPAERKLRVPAAPMLLVRRALPVRRQQQPTPVALHGYPGPDGWPSEPAPMRARPSVQWLAPPSRPVRWRVRRA